MTGVRVSNAGPNRGTVACASCAAPPGHASRGNEAPASARRPPRRTCSPSPRSDQVVAVGLRCGKASFKTFLPGHEVAVGLRCGKANSKTLLPGHEVVVGLRRGKANTNTLKSLARLDPVSPRDSSGRSIFFTIKEDSSRLATSFPFSNKANGKEPSLVGHMLPTTRAPLMKTPTGSAGPGPSSRTLTHVHQAASPPVE